MPPPDQWIDRFANSREDYRQDRQVLAVEYYGNAWERLSSGKRANVDKWYRSNREQYQSAAKREGETVQLLDEYPLAEPPRPVLSYDVRRCLEMLWREFPDEIVDVAFDMITLENACQKLVRCENTVRKQVRECRTKARSFLGREFEEKDWLHHKHKVCKNS
jgi:hypothetical protein